MKTEPIIVPSPPRTPEQAGKGGGRGAAPDAGAARADAARGKAAPAKAGAEEEIYWRGHRGAWVAGGGLLAAIFAWAYWPTLELLVRAWDRQPDYSHGYLVVPLALYFLWARRDLFPGRAERVAWTGLVLIGLAVVMRAAAALVYLDVADAWSILPWVAGVVWLFWGWRVLWWSLPSVAFLWFMIPLPFAVGHWLSLPLQRVATKISCWTLQMLGQPAIAQGNVILLGEHRLEVEQACSGLRIFMGIIALAFAYLILVRRNWWERALLLASALPVALVANSTRVVVTGLLYQWASSEAAHRFTHDLAGWVMIPFAAGLFALVLLYVGKLTREVEQLDVGDIVRREQL